MENSVQIVDAQSDETLNFVTVYYSHSCNEYSFDINGETYYVDTAEAADEIIRFELGVNYVGSVESEM